MRTMANKVRPEYRQTHNETYAMLPPVALFGAQTHSGYAMHMMTHALCSMGDYWVTHPLTGNSGNDSPMTMPVTP